jgi:cell division protein FtsL
MNGTMRWVILFSLVLVVPLLFVANVWQSYRYVRLEQSLQAMQTEHVRLLEENKRLIVGIAGLRSPARIRAIAEEDLGLAPVPSSRVRRIEIEGGLRGQ